jgi:hypothetical protein
MASVTNIDKEYVSKFKTMIYKFIWNVKREKVKRETMNKNYLEGGLFVNSDIQLVFKDSFFNMKFSDSFPS